MSYSYARSSSAVRVSSPLTGRRQLPGFSLSGAGYRRSSPHAGYTEDHSSLSDSETGSLYGNTHVTAAPWATEKIQTERTLDATKSSHERKPHTRPIPRDSSMQPLLTRATVSLRSFGKSLANIEEVDDRFVAPFVVVPRTDYSVANLRQ